MTRIPSWSVLVCAGLLCVAACASPAPPTGAAAASPVATMTSAGVLAPPEWRPGDRWTYGWTMGGRSGTKVVEVLASRQIGGTDYYVVRVANLDHLYTRDLQWAGALRDGREEIRMTPPLPWFSWPLQPGRRWSYRGTYEDRNGKEHHSDSFAVIGEETVDVPAGRFRALKIVREGSSMSGDQYWYSPDVRFYIKWAGHRADADFEEQLQSARTALGPVHPPDLAPGSATLGRSPPAGRRSPEIGARKAEARGSTGPR